MANLLDNNAKLYAIDMWVDYKDIQNIPEMKEKNASSLLAIFN